MEILRIVEDPELRPALEYDLIKLGVRLRWFLDDDDDRLDWSDLVAIVFAGPQTSQLNLVKDPEQSVWTPEMMLLAAMTDELSWQSWTKTKDGSKGKNPPDKIERPGVEPKKKTKTIGGDQESVKTAAEMMEFLGIA